MRKLSFMCELAKSLTSGRLNRRFARDQRPSIVRFFDEKAARFGRRGLPAVRGWREAGRRPKVPFRAFSERRPAFTARY